LGFILRPLLIASLAARSRQSNIFSGVGTCNVEG
jgi:hypothetical protein